MTSLLRPGAHRAAGVADDEAFAASMLRVEAAWSQAAVEAGVFPADALLAPIELNAADREALARDAEAGGNPVIPLVALLRDRQRGEAARWLHRGLTSQDVVDTALMLCAARARARVLTAIGRQVEVLVGLVERHRACPALARTLTQPAVPTVLGLRFAGWLHGVLDAADDLAALRLPAQFGGAAGTGAALTELAGDPTTALAVTDRAARLLDLEPARPWHTTRRPITRIGDALVACTDAFGHVAGDVLLGSRAEIGELAEGVGGGSSTMPGKANPVLATLVRAAALAAPAAAATLHAAAADAVDERTPGGWHAEWPALADLLTRTVVAADQTADLLAGLVVHPERAAAHLAAADGVRAEQAAMAALRGAAPAEEYLGTAALQIDAALARAAASEAAR